MKRVTISTRDGRIVHINPDHIATFESTNDGRGTSIRLSDGQELLAQEPPGRVWRRIRQADGAVFLDGREASIR